MEMFYFFNLDLCIVIIKVKCLLFKSLQGLYICRLSQPCGHEGLPVSSKFKSCGTVHFRSGSTETVRKGTGGYQCMAAFRILTGNTCTRSTARCNDYHGS